MQNDVKQELGTNFIEYAVAVNTDRAIPDSKSGVGDELILVILEILLDLSVGDLDAAYRLFDGVVREKLLLDALKLSLELRIALVEISRGVEDEERLVYELFENHCASLRIVIGLAALTHSGEISVDIGVCDRLSVY